MRAACVCVGGGGGRACVCALVRACGVCVCERDPNYMNQHSRNSFDQ